MAQTYRVSIWRGGADGALRHYDVPARANQTVLDVVTHVQRHIDPTLAYRFACRVGMCGSCAMTVNGVPRWTCRSHVAKVVTFGRLTIEPLANLPIVKDLVCDMAPFFDKWQRAGGRFEPGATRDDPLPEISPESQPRQLADEAIECINCGVCYAACETVRWDETYLGPAALNRAWSLVNDERDAGRLPRLTAISAEGGCHSCHSHQSCTLRCPVALDPARSIAGLKRETVKAFRAGELR